MISIPSFRYYRKIQNTIIIANTHGKKDSRDFLPQLSFFCKKFLRASRDKQVIAHTASYGIMGNMSYTHGKQKSMGNYFCADFIKDCLPQAHIEYNPLYIYRYRGLI